MKPTNLSQRQKNIIHILAQSNNSYITVQNIADRFDLSARTVQRDLVGIEDFLYDNDFLLIKKPGNGLMLNENKESIDFLYELLDMVDSSKQYEKAERVNFILARLLTSKQAIKSFAFTVYLNISERTLTEDLNFIEKWLSLYDIKLVRKRGEGISIEGDERSIRKAQAKLINEVLNDDKKIEILRNINDKAKIDLIKQNDVLQMIDRQIIEKTRNALNKAFEKLNISISDNAYISLLVHISLAIERLKQDKTLTYKEEIIKDLKDTKEYRFSKIIIEELEKEFDQQIPDIEIYFIAMHMKGTKIIKEDSKDLESSDDKEAFNIANALIYQMEDIYKLNLIADFRLENDLKAHLVPALTRLKFNFPIKNPILADIKDKYQEIFQDLKRIAPDIIRKGAGLDPLGPIPDDEIGYIAIHFINSIEGKIVEDVLIRALTVCPTGYGTSKLLATNIINHFNNINIVANASIMEINKDFLNTKDIDLIISTIDIDNIIENNQITDVAYLNMPAIPDESDYLNLSALLRKISREKYYSKHDKRKQPRPRYEKKDDSSLKLAKNLYELSQNLDQVYRQIKYISLDSGENLEAKVAKSLGGSDKDFRAIRDGLIERNKISPTYYEELNLHLLHAKCQLDHPILAFGKIKDKNENLVLMISSLDKSPGVIELFSAISSKLAEDQNFLDAIDQEDETKINNMVINIIYGLLEEKIKLWRENNEA